MFKLFPSLFSRVMDLRAEGESVDVEGDHVVMFARRMKENSRDYHRRLIAELARSNIGKLLLSVL